MTKNRFFALCGLTLCLALLEGKPATATTLKALSLSQLADRAQLVAQIRVIGSYCEWRTNLIYTVTEVAIENVFKGERKHNGEVVRIVQLGGEVGQHAMPVIGGVDYQVGHQAVVFLMPTHIGEGEFYLAGMSQGSLDLRDDGGLIWAPTAMLWDGRQLTSPQPRLLTLADVRRAVEAQ